VRIKVMTQRQNDCVPWPRIVQWAAAVHTFLHPQNEKRAPILSRSGVPGVLVVRRQVSKGLAINRTAPKER
jgi:hypothetical protein